jgi:hypothetical protein
VNVWLSPLRPVPNPDRHRLFAGGGLEAFNV